MSKVGFSVGEKSDKFDSSMRSSWISFLGADGLLETVWPAVSVKFFGVWTRPKEAIGFDGF